MAHFADSVIARARRLGHPLCLGLDPHLDLFPPLFRRGAMAPDDPSTLAMVETLLLAVLERSAERVVIVKPQIAFFERLGSGGLEILTRLCARARALDLPILLDAKRGDIGSTASAYAGAYLSPDAPLKVNALTVNPYLGLDTIEPFASAAWASGGGIFVLVKTSNPGSGDFQDLEIDGQPLFLRVAERLAPSALEMRGETGWSSLGVVVGATHPDDAPRVRELLPHSLFLVPGYGAQGGSARDAVRGFVPGPDGRLEGGLVSSSRAIVFPAAAASADSALAWERAIDQALDRAVTELGEAVAG